MKIEIAETNKQLDQCYSIRTKVFIDEQQVPVEIELDEHDASAIHFVGYVDDEAIAASRLRFVDEYGKLERICILKLFRGKSYGKQLIQAMEEVIRMHGYKQAKLNAQTHAQSFYQKLGYETVSEEFIDAGIPHVTMIKHIM